MVPTSPPEGAEDGVEEARPGGGGLVGAREVIPAHYQTLGREKRKQRVEGGR